MARVTGDIIAGGLAKGLEIGSAHRKRFDEMLRMAKRDAEYQNFQLLRQSKEQIFRQQLQNEQMAQRRDEQEARRKTELMKANLDYDADIAKITADKKRDIRAKKLKEDERFLSTYKSLQTDEATLLNRLRIAKMGTGITKEVDLDRIEEIQFQLENITSLRKRFAMEHGGQMGVPELASSMKDLEDEIKQKREEAKSLFDLGERMMGGSPIERALREINEPKSFLQENQMIQKFRENKPNWGKYAE